MQSRGSKDIGCELARQDLAEMALGVLNGEERARVVAHVNICEECAQELERLCAAVDGLTELVRVDSPPEGFADRTVAAFGADRGERSRPTMTRWRRPAWIAAAAAVIVIGLGFGVGEVVGSHHPTDHVSKRPSTTQGASAALLSATHPASKIGKVVMTPGSHAWVMLTMEVPPHTGTVTCRVRLSDGHELLVGHFATGGEYTSWGVELPVPASSVHKLTVSDSKGKAVARADFR
jgi:hypothetical protein